MSDVSTGTIPTFTALLKASVANYMQNVFAGWMPGRIQTVTGRKATIELLIQDVEETRLGRTVKPFGLLQNVPIVFPGQGGAYLEWPVKSGDTVLVLFGARATDRYLQTGGSVDPDDVRNHDINDAIAFPVASFDFVHASSANPQIKFTGTTIEAGGAAALALQSELGSLKAALQSFITAMNAVSSPITGTAVGSALTTALTSQGILSPTWPPGTAKLKGG